MKRDMDLIRQLVFQIEASNEPIQSEQIILEGYGAAQIGYHCGLMHESGLIVAQDSEHLDSINPEYYILRLTSAGHDFADAARNDTLWNKATTTVKDKVGGLTIEMLIIYLKQLAAERLGIGN